MAVVDDLPAGFPFLPLAEQGAEPAPPAAGSRRLYVDTTGQAWLVDSAGDAVAVGNPDAVTAVGTITKIDGPMTQTEYDAIVTPAADTLYVIVGA